MAPDARRIRIATLLGLVGIALLAVGPALLHPDSAVGENVDLWGTLWFHWWMDHALSLGLNPNHSSWLFHPIGKDILADTGSNLVDAVLALPFRHLFGYPAYQPWLAAVVLVGNGLCFAPLARQQIADPVAAATATLLFAMNPAVLHELAEGRMAQALLWGLPLATLALLQLGARARAGEGPGWRPVLLLGVAFALQAWIYWFMAVFMAVGFCWLLLFEAWGARRSGPRGWGGLFVGVGLAALLAVLLAAPALVQVLAQAKEHALPGMIAPVSGAGAAGIDPGALSALNNRVFGAIPFRGPGPYVLDSPVWAGGLLLALLLGADRGRWTGLAIITALFAAGPAVGDLSKEGVPMLPYLWAWRAVPFLGRLWFPERVLAVTVVGLCLGGGLALAWLRARLPRLAPFLPLGILALAVGERVWHHHLPLERTTLSNAGIYELVGEEGGGIVELPLGMARISIAMQPIHQQPVFGGMGENVPELLPRGWRERLDNPLILAFQQAWTDPREQSPVDPSGRAALVSDGFRWVVLDRAALEEIVGHLHPEIPAGTSSRSRLLAAIQNRMSDLLGAPVAVEGPLLLWDLEGRAQAPPEIAASAERLRADWETQGKGRYLTWLTEHDREKRPRGDVARTQPLEGPTETP